MYNERVEYLRKWLVLQGTTYSNFEEAARAIKTWSVYQTTSLEIAKAFNLSKPDSFAVGTKFELNNRRLKSVESDSHPAFQSKKNLSEQILEFVLQEEMPPYLPYSNDNNDRIFALPQQVLNSRLITFLIERIEFATTSVSSLYMSSETHSNYIL